MENDELVQNMLLELRRGILSLAVLSQLGKEEYGYSLLKALSEQGMEIDQSTLYPLLRRLESQGLLQSDWRIVDEARPRRYYVISTQGREVLAKLKIEWSAMAETMQKIVVTHACSRRLPAACTATRHLRRRQEKKERRRTK
jgi:PadR family transcriptional regulator, regulatory protein PadR